STVTVFYAANYCNIPGVKGETPSEMLQRIATQMPPLQGSYDVLLLLSVPHARVLYEAGYSKRNIQERLWELARLPSHYFSAGFVKAEVTAGRGDTQTIWRGASANNFHIVVAGAGGLVAGGLEPQDVYIAVKNAQTRVIRGDYPPPPAAV